jgi:hypothetical protein
MIGKVLFVTVFVFNIECKQYAASHTYGKATDVDE